MDRLASTGAMTTGAGPRRVTEGACATSSEHLLDGSELTPVACDMDMRALLETELQRRRERNPRYSLRAFARSLDTHHSTVSRILRSQRRLTPRAIRRFGKVLKLSPARIEAACVAEHCASIRRLVSDARFRADSRWLAMMTGIPLHDVNVALHWLLHRRELTMSGPQTWTLSEELHAASSDSLADPLSRP